MLRNRDHTLSHYTELSTVKIQVYFNCIAYYRGWNLFIECDLIFLHTLCYRYLGLARLGR